MNYEAELDDCVAKMFDSIEDTMMHMYLYGLYVGLTRAALTACRDAENLEFAE